MHLVIDGSKIMSEEDLHTAIAKGLDLPIWYGRNLDALWDVLTGMVGRPLKITWMDAEQSKERLPRYEKYISLLQDVAEQDRQLKRPEFLTLEINQLESGASPRLISDGQAPDDPSP